MQNDIQQGTMDTDADVVVNEAQFSKFVHKETHAGPGHADHLRKRLLADFRDHRLRFAFLAKVRQQQEQTGKMFLTRIEQLIDEVCFDADRPAQKMSNEHLGERGSSWITRTIAAFSSRTMTDSVIVATVAIRYLPGKTSFTEKFVRSKNCNDCFLALLRNDSGLHLAFLDVEDRIRRVSL